MLIPPRKMQETMVRHHITAKESVYMRSSHVYIQSELAYALFAEAPNVDVVYYGQRNQLFIASSTDADFKKLHKSKQYMLKNRNAEGDKTIALHELIIDHNIDDTDRPLMIEYDLTLKILKITF